MLRSLRQSRPSGICPKSRASIRAADHQEYYTARYQSEIRKRERNGHKKAQKSQNFISVCAFFVPLCGGHGAVKMSELFGARIFPPCGDPRRGIRPGSFFTAPYAAASAVGIGGLKRLRFLGSITALLNWR